MAYSYASCFPTLTLSHSQKHANENDEPVVLNVDSRAESCDADRHEERSERHQSRVAARVDDWPANQWKNDHWDWVDREDQASPAWLDAFVV